MPEPDVPRDLRREAHIRAVAIWTILGAIFMVLGALRTLFAGSQAFEDAGLSRKDEELLHLVCVAVPGAVGMLAIFVGSGLWEYRRWARIVYGVIAVLGILASGLLLLFALHGGAIGAAATIVLQIAWTGICLWAIFGGSSSQVFSQAYRNAVARGQERVPWWGSPVFYVPFLLIVIVIGLLAVVWFASGPRSRA